MVLQLELALLEPLRVLALPLKAAPAVVDHVHGLLHLLVQQRRDAVMPAACTTKGLALPMPASTPSWRRAALSGFVPARSSSACAW